MLTPGIGQPLFRRDLNDEELLSGTLSLKKNIYKIAVKCGGRLQNTQVGSY